MARRNGGFVGQDGLDAPDPPTGVTPTAGNAQVSVAFTAPSNAGTSAITNFVVQLSTDDTAYSAASNTGTSSPIVISSLTNDTAATVKVWAINAYGTSAPSEAISATPAAARGLFAGAHNGDYVDVIDYVSIASAGNASTFGALTEAAEIGAALASSTRGVFHIGRGENTSGGTILEYITIGSTGNSTDFGDPTQGRRSTATGGSGTRGILSGGDNGSGTKYNVIDYITIASTGNASDFGDLAAAINNHAGAGGTTRSVFFGGSIATSDPNNVNTIQYITTASTGNATDFGDVSTPSSVATAGSANHGGLQ